jgi:hypothetical protein
MLLHGGELLLNIFGLMGEDFLGILRLNELLGVLERRLQIRFGEAERLRADVLGARLQRNTASSSARRLALGPKSLKLRLPFDSSWATTVLISARS